MRRIGREGAGTCHPSSTGVSCWASAVPSERSRPSRRLVLQAQADRVELGRFAKRTGVQGKMTGAQAVAAALCCEGVRCVFGIPGAQNNELWDALQGPSVSLPAGRPRGVGQRHGRRLGAGHRRGRRLLGRARPGADQRH